MNQQETYSTEDLLEAIQQRNLVYNFNFLNYSNQTGSTPVVYNHPDGWVYEDKGSGGEITYNTNQQCCLIKTSSGSDEMTFSQAIHEFPRWRQILIGRTVSAAAVITSAGTSSQVTFSIYDGVYETTKTYTLEADTRTVMNIDVDIQNAATELVVSIKSESSSVSLNIYEIYANIGKMALNTLPCMVEGIIGQRSQYISTETAPQTELSLCAAAQELSAGYSRLNSVLNGRFGTGSNGRSLLPDMRGYFSRAWDNGSATDPNANNRTALGGDITGDHVSTVQQDEFKEHDHQLKFNTTKPASADKPTVTTIDPMSTSNTEKTGGDETRPKNIYELYTIKWA